MIRDFQLDEADPLILRLLRERGKFDAAKMDLYRDSKAKDDEMPERILARLGLCDEDEIAATYSVHLAIPICRRADEDGPLVELARLLPEKLVRDQLIAPCRRGTMSSSWRSRPRPRSWSSTRCSS